MIHIGAKIPDDLARQIEQIAPFCRGGKSQVIRCALKFGLEHIYPDGGENFSPQIIKTKNLNTKQP
jgi:hypothetical protein